MIVEDVPYAALPQFMHRMCNSLTILPARPSPPSFAQGGLLARSILANEPVGADRIRPPHCRGGRPRPPAARHEPHIVLAKGSISCCRAAAVSRVCVLQTYRAASAARFAPAGHDIASLRYALRHDIPSVRYAPSARKSLQGGLSRGINAKKDGAFCAVPFGCPGDYSIVMLCVSGSFGCSAFGNSRVRTPFSYLHLIDSGRMSPT